MDRCCKIEQEVCRLTVQRPQQGGGGALDEELQHTDQQMEGDHQVILHLKKTSCTTRERKERPAPQGWTSGQTGKEVWLGRKESN